LFAYCEKKNFLTKKDFYPKKGFQSKHKNQQGKNTQKMAKDVATYIWELAKADKNLDGLTLKQLFKKKLEIDRDELREKLRDLVAQKIKSERQIRCELTLDDNMIFGGFCVARLHGSHEVKPKSTGFVQDFADGRWLEVSNPETKTLIEYAILPLQLKWSIMPGSNQITISWAHWKNESN
jgi:hypothetical protein